MIKTLLMTDLDGTLLPSNKMLASVDLEAIARFRETGGLFTIATGRTVQAASSFLKILKPDVPCILFNGAMIYDVCSDSVLDSVTLPLDAMYLTKEILDVFPQVSAEILRPDATYVSRLTSYEQDHLDICHVKPILCNPEDVPIDDWLKVLFTVPAEEMETLRTYLVKKNIPYADFVQSERHFYEMLPKGITKGSALRKYRTLLGLGDYTMVAAGDYDNDLEMLRAANVSACPSNAQPCVQKIATIRLKQSCDTGAIAELIDRLLV